MVKAMAISIGMIVSTWGVAAYTAVKTPPPALSNVIQLPEMEITARAQEAAHWACAEGFGEPYPGGGVVIGCIAGHAQVEWLSDVDQH
jgi:hypothetical protein